MEDFQVSRQNRSKRCFKVSLGICLYLSIIPVLLFIIAFVIVPIVFKYSPGIQRSIILPTWSILAAQNYSEPNTFGIKGVNNFYLNVVEDENVTLGIWQILPQEYLTNENFDYIGAMNNTKYSILIYLHGNGSDRTLGVDLYEILRKFFHIFAVDYRGYADSSKAPMTANGMASDIVGVYKWLKSNSKSNIFIWGHSLGTGISTHLISKLKSQKLNPLGLILETPFTSVVDVMRENPIIKVMTLFPWGEWSFIQPIIDNDLNFNSSRYILDVDCPIMILHARDDDIIPYEIAVKLYETAEKQRNHTMQGGIIFHLFGAEGYKHMNLFEAPELPVYTSDFIAECQQFQEKRLNGSIRRKIDYHL